MWLLTDAVVPAGHRRAAVAYGSAALLFLPSLLLVNGVHEWTERTLGFGHAASR